MCREINKSKKDYWKTILQDTVNRLQAKIRQLNRKENFDDIASKSPTCTQSNLQSRLPDRVKEFVDQKVDSLMS